MVKLSLFGKQPTLKEQLTKTDATIELGKSKHVGVLSFYSGLLAKFLDHDDIPKDSLGNGQFYYTAESIYTKNGIKKPFYILDLPAELSRGFVSDLRDAIASDISSYNLTTNSPSGIDANVAVNLIEDCRYYPLNLESRATKSRWLGTARMYQSVVKKMENRTLEDELKSDKYSKQMKRKVESYLHIKEALESQQASFYKTLLILELEASAENLVKANDALKVAEKSLKMFTIKYDIKYKRLFMTAHEYYKNYAPTSSFNDTTLMRRSHQGDVFSDDTLSSFLVPEHGKVGDALGVYQGIDVQSREVITVDFANGNDAKNILLTASTGEGKSMAAKMYYSFYALDPQYQTIVFDYEGTEYQALGKISDATFIAMAGTAGTYVNTMVIPEKTGDSELDLARKIEAMTMTEKVIGLLVADPESDSSSLSNENKAIFSDLLSLLYTDNGISDQNPDLWHEQSKDLTFYSLYAKLEEIIERGRNATGGSQFLKDHNFEDVIAFRNGLMVYFKKGSANEHWFKNPISIDEFLKSKDVIFNFGMGGVSESSVDKKQLALRQMFSSHLTMLKSARNKLKGVRTVVFVEELQRYIKHRDSSSIVATMVSGGRKLGMVVYLITNAPSELIHAADGSSPVVEKNASAILSNVTMYIIGALYRSEMDDLIAYFGLDNARGYLEELVDIKENDRVNAPLKNCFYMKFRGYQTIVKVISHPMLDDLPIYTTKPSVANSDLRTTNQVSDNKLNSTLMDAFDTNEEWNKQGLNYNQRLGQRIEKTWK